MTSENDIGDAHDRLLNSCPSCTEILDVTDLEPYAKIVCPHCGDNIRVRQQFDEFIIIDQIGEGGMSRVFRAVDSLLNREVALKILNEEFCRDEARIKQFEKEAHITASISHPNVVKVFKVGRDQGLFYIAMELVDGGSLEADIKSHTRLTEERVLEIAAQVSQGLRAAKQAGLIHRDIKPGNILFTGDGTSKIVDFGLSLIHGKEVDTSGEIWATPFYVPPEQLFDEPEDFRGDIYSLGASLFHAIAGRPPYEADTNSLEKLRRIKSKPVKLASAAPQASLKTREVIDRTLALKPDERYPNYNAMLEAVNDARSLLRNPAVRIARRITATRRRRVALLAGFATLCALLSGILFLVARGNQNGQDPDDNGGGGGPAVTGKGITLGTGDRTPSEVYLRGRKAMFAGNLEKASEDFSLLLAPESKTLQPTKNWTRFNAGICALLEGAPQRSRGHFLDLRREGRFSTDDADAELCVFFETIGTELSGPRLPQPDSVKFFNRDGVGALGLLACGLAHWNIGSPAQAVTFLNRFAESSPGDMTDPWPLDYKEITKPYLEDFALLSNLPKPSDDLDLPAAMAYRQSLDEIVRQLHTTGAPQKIVQKWRGDIDAHIIRLEKEAELAARERLEQARREEIDAFLALVRSLEPFRDTGDFITAQKLLLGSEFQSPEVQAALEDQIYLWQTAEEFLNQLIRDLNGLGYSGPIKRVGAPPLEGGTVIEASRTEIRIRLGAGETRIALNDVPPSGLVEIAASISETIPNSSEYYRRQEFLVVYSRVTKLHTLAKAYGDRLMRENRSFRLRWSRILEADADSF